LKFFTHLLDASLIAVESGEGGILADARWTARLLALHVAHRLDDIHGPDRPADAPAGHGVALADAADGDDLIGERGSQGRKARRLGIAENELLVDLVTDDAKLRFQRDIGQRFELGSAIDDAGRIAR